MRSAFRLFHFTHVQNLPSIAKLGLRPRESLNAQGVDFAVFDETRFDLQFEPSGSLCLSLGHTHDAFARVLGASEDSAKNYVVLELSESILRTTAARKIAVYPTNAASREILQHMEDLKNLEFHDGTRFVSPFIGLSGLNQLFSQDFFVTPTQGVQSSSRLRKFSRKALGVPEGCPNDPQAEIHISEQIQPEAILKTWHHPKLSSSSPQMDLIGRFGRVPEPSPLLFSRRSDVTDWVGKRVDVQDYIRSVWKERADG
jgi:hypothetical protein